VNAVTAFVTVRFLHLGHAGLALSLSMVSIFNAIVLLALIRPRIGGIRGHEVARSFGKILVAAAVMGAVILTVVHFSTSRAVDVLAGIPIGAAVFYSIASWLHIPELADARDALLRKLR
jgi:peptidoglycan biosynthesis protein MviN/MurJ (putative lipid II flippase)